MTTYIPVSEIKARLGLTDGAVWSMLHNARSAIRVRPSTPKLICWEDVQAWRDDALLRGAATPWHVESREHYEARHASRKDGPRHG